MSRIITSGIYNTTCENVTYNKLSNKVYFSFNIDNIKIRKIFTCNENKANYLLSLKDNIFKVNIANYSNGTEQRIVELYTKNKTNQEWKNLYSKYKSLDKEANIEDELLSLEKSILDIDFSGFLHRNKKIEIVKKFIDEYDKYIKVFCSKYNFTMRKNKFGNNEFIIDINVDNNLKRIIQDRFEKRCIKYNILSKNKENRLLKSEMQGILGEATMAIFLNALWSFLLIGKKIHINDKMYKNNGDGGADFMVGVLSVDVKNRNNVPTSDLILNYNSFDKNTLMLLTTCTQEFDNLYYQMLYQNTRLTHKSILTGYTDAFNFQKNYKPFGWSGGKFLLEHQYLLNMDDYIKLVIIEALKEEVPNETTTAK